MGIKKNYIMSFILVISLITNVMYAITLQEIKASVTVANTAASEIVFTSQNEALDLIPQPPLQIEQLIVNNYYYEDEPASIPFEAKTLYTTAKVNARAGATERSTVVETLSISKPYLVVDECDGWYKIDLDGSYAYVRSTYMSETAPSIKISATCYYNEYDRPAASGRELVMGKSLAGMVEWLGRQVRLYRVNEDGSKGEFLGVYTFDDTGYGQETGQGQSKILEGKSIGTIENGTCIDVYMNTYADCCTWGRQDVYIEFI